MESQPKRGKLSLFLGMAPGVGKTHAMLQAAQKEKASGRDVVVCCVDTHQSNAVEVLLKGLPHLNRQDASAKVLATADIDVEAVLARRPHLVVVDNLAHGNVSGARHPQRYQDVAELLDADIDVLATLNVQNVASRSDTVQHITGITVLEIVPDSVLDEAIIELVDLAPEKLIRRFREGKTAVPKSFGVPNTHFFREGNLSALREISLRLVAERVGHDVRDYMAARQIPGPWKSGHRLLVGVGPGPVSEQIVRWARRLADSLDCPWTALYVESSRALAKSEQSRVTHNLALARRLGAEVITTSDENVVRGLLRVATQRNVTQIVVGKPFGGSLWKFFRRDLFLRRLVRESGGIDIHVVRADRTAPETPARPRLRVTPSGLRQYGAATGVVFGVTVAVCLPGKALDVHAAALIYLLAVVMLALFVEWGPTLLAATLSALVWDYFFLPPVFAFRVTHFEDAMLLGMYFVIAIVLGQFTTRLRSQEKAERQREERATALYLLMRELSEAAGPGQIVARLVQHTERVFQAPTGVLLEDPANRPGAMPLHPASTFLISGKEQAIAKWVVEHGQPAGKFTDNLPEAEGLYVPLTTSNGTVGVMGLRLTQSFSPTIHQRNLLDAFSQQAALALDRQRLQEVSEQTRVLAESERLSKTMLNSMSHEIRTPIAAIQGATGNLLELAAGGGSEEQGAMIAEIQEATGRLNRLVGNMLDMTRLESGHVRPKLNLCDVRDLVHVAVKETRKQLAQHRLAVEVAPDLPLVRMDFVLMQQALTNLLSNAAFHTPAGTAMQMTARQEGENLVFVVADAGPGIAPDSMPRLFDKFYRAPGARAGGTGLGLSLVKGFVEAQGGRVEAANQISGGAIFTIRLPVGEPEKNERML